jgi:hypothetical protein
MEKNTMVIVIVAFMLGCCLKQLLNPVCGQLNYERFATEMDNIPDCPEKVLVQRCSQCNGKYGPEEDAFDKNNNVKCTLKYNCTVCKKKDKKVYEGNINNLNAACSALNTIEQTTQENPVPAKSPQSF